MKEKLSERLFLYCIVVCVCLVTLSILYPFVYLISVSISSSRLVSNGEIVLFPREVNADAYLIMLRSNNIFRAYLNTVVYSVVGTLLGLLFNSMTAYPLSLSVFPSRKAVTLLFMVTMFFSGGLIPFYLVVKGLGMLNTLWALTLPGAVSVWYLIIFRTFFQEIDKSMRESAIIEGANDLLIFIKIILPLSKPVLATIGLFYMVNVWNNYFGPLIFITQQEKFPLQVVLRRILTMEYALKTDTRVPYEIYDKVAIESLRAAAIILTSIPVICIYPFIQRYFVKGVMIGAIKG